MIASIASVLGWVIRLIYELVNNNYFLSIILFTILTKLILLPLYLMQMKSTEKLNSIAPKDAAIREKYKNDKEKQAEQIAKLYSENKINPLGGCLPVLIQLPIILAMFYIVKQPLTYITQTPKDEIRIYTQESLKKEKLEDVTDDEMQANELTVAREKGLINMEVVSGINLGDVPSNVFSKDESNKANPLALLVPIITVIMQLVQIKVTQKTSTMSEDQIQMQKTMNLMMPLFSGFIAFIMPLALGVYWLFGNILQIIQQIVINQIIKKDKEKNNLTLDKGGV